MSREQCIKSIRVLVVEDSVAFGRFVCSILGERRDLEIMSQVSDGLEAVQKAEELQPDLILLDIGLPILNGIEAGTTNPQSFAYVPDNLREPGIFCRRDRKSFELRGNGIRYQNSCRKRTAECCANGARSG